MPIIADKIYLGSTVVSSGSNPWVRNPAWLALPTVGNTEQKFVGLVAVWPENNFLAMIVSGDYTVNWGDGVTENVAAGVRASHEYTFSDADLANTNGPVTFQDTGDTVTRTAHGYTNGMLVSFSTITTTTGIVAGQAYYVVNATANTFQVSASSGGSVLPLTNNGSGTILPYKQAIVTVTPQAGQNLTSLDLNAVFGTFSVGSGYASGWLDIIISGPNLSTLGLSASVPNVTFRWLEQAQLISSNSITSFSNKFNGCSRLQSLPTWVVSSTSGAVDMANMFTNCLSLPTIPLMNTAAVTNMSFMFSGCTNLQSIPLINTSSVSTMASMFQSCSSLRTIPLLNTASVNTMLSMFQSCGNLKSIPALNTALVTTMNSMFLSCTSLETIPLLNMVSVTNTQFMFQTCSSLQTIPLLNTAAVTNFAQMFQNCASLKAVPAINMGGGTSSGSYNVTFPTSGSIASLKATNIKFTFSISNHQLSAAALDEIYTNLPTVVGQTITVTSNYGTSSDNPAIATAKGWTVTG